MNRLSALAAASIVAAAPLLAQKPRQVADINDHVLLTSGRETKPRASRPSDGLLFLTAETTGTGDELFSCDGTGVRLVKDIRPGAASSSPRDLVFAGDTLYFTADDGVHGRELWKSDGTEAGTVLVLDIRPGWPSSSPDELVVTTDGWVYFTANDGTHGRELWLHDGSSPPRLVYDIRRGSSGSLPRGLIAVGTNVFLAADDGFTGLELWAAHLSAYRVADINPGAASGVVGSSFATVGHRVFFPAYSPSYGKELWTSTGSGAALVKDVSPGGGSGLQQRDEFAVVGSTIFFAAKDPTGTELWKTNGTAAGTVRVKDINPPASSYPIWLTPFGNRVVFSAHTATYGLELWSSDGTDSGTVLLKDINRGPGVSDPVNLTVVGGSIYFTAETPAHGRELWRTTGTSSGTTLVKDILPGATSSAPQSLHGVGNTLYFSNSNNAIAGLWRSSGSALTTYRVDTPASVSASPKGFTTVGDAVYFVADDQVNGAELWMTDASGTRLVKDVYPGASSSQPDYLCRLGDKLLFRARTMGAGEELWESDGTSAGTRLLADLVRGSGGSSPSHITRVGGKVVFATRRRSGPTVVWELRAGRTSFPVIRSWNSLFWVPYFAPVGSAGSFVFAGVGNTELWISDGTAAGTKELKDIHPSGNSSPSEMTAFGDKVVFAATTPASGREVWITDGTAAGTVLLKDIVAGTLGSNPGAFAARADACFFIAQGDVLWKTDGTTAGTVAVKDLGSSATVDSLTIVGSRKLLLRVDDKSGKGSELWISDGTTAGTRLLADVDPGAASGLPIAGPFGAVADVYFAGADGTKGTELWSYTPGATTWRGGDGCGTATRVPRLLATDPVLGATQRITSRRIKSGSIGTLLLGFDGRQQLASGCTLWLHPWKPWFFLEVWLQGTGDHVTQLAIPNDTNLEGLKLTLQTVVAPTDAANGFDVSNAVRQVFGR